MPSLAASLQQSIPNSVRVATGGKDRVVRVTNDPKDGS